MQLWADLETLVFLLQSDATFRRQAAHLCQFSHVAWNTGTTWDLRAFGEVVSRLVSLYLALILSLLPFSCVLACDNQVCI